MLSLARRLLEKQGQKSSGDRFTPELPLPAELAKCREGIKLNLQGPWGQKKQWKLEGDMFGLI